VTCTTGSPVAFGPQSVSPTTASQGSASYTSGSTTNDSATGVYAWVAAYNGNHNNNPVTSGCTAELVNVVGVGAIYATGTTCADFIAPGSAENPTFDLDQIHYAVSAGKIGQSVNPGVFFYYTEFTPTSANFTVNLNQADFYNFGTGSQTSAPSGLLFGVLNAPGSTSQVGVFNGNCSSFSGTTTITFSGTNSSQTQVAVTGATPNQPIIISIKYQTKTISGQPAPSPPTVHYTFSTVIGTTVYDIAVGGVDLVTP
jgi:hypothetical protein